MPHSSLSDGVTYIVEVAAGATILGIATWNAIIVALIKRLRADLESEREKLHKHMLDNERRIAPLEKKEKTDD